MKFLWASILIATSFVSAKAFAMPELTRFGYNTCMACHLSPTGGGLLTPYGRKVAAELLNTWGNESQTGVFWGALDQDTLEKYLWLGGDARGAQVHYEDDTVKMGRWIKMQAEISGAWVRDSWALFASVGKIENDQWNAKSSSFYTKYNPLNELSLRVGRFIPAYGLHLSDHIAFIRSVLGFGLEANRDAAEVHWQGENHSFTVTHSESLKRPDPEKADAFQGQIYLLDRIKLGVDYWHGNSETLKRDLYGLWGVIGFSQKWYWLTEVDVQKTQTPASQESLTTYQRLAYTCFKGFDLSALYEAYQSDRSDSQTLMERRGPGFQWYPLAHFEFSGAWTKQKQRTPSVKESDYAWFVAHYYF